MARVPGVGSGASGHVVVVLVSSDVRGGTSSGQPCCARDEAATSFLLLRLQRTTTCLTESRCVEAGKVGMASNHGKYTYYAAALQAVVARNQPLAAYSF
ncbi:hypothetical protein TRIUR3_15175 [Triticum urartu]|uniref:Uncharacterized protein n=1 Tax=Triticum urartu TaxID=4572 RepID=M7ZBT0_TRIUA|nr:hypothetical protein TRIUR3_15175 [Triticum urartu]